MVAQRITKSNFVKLKAFSLLLAPNLLPKYGSIGISFFVLAEAIKITFAVSICRSTSTAMSPPNESPISVG